MIPADALCLSSQYISLDSSFPLFPAEAKKIQMYRDILLTNLSWCHFLLSSRRFL